LLEISLDFNYAPLTYYYSRHWKFSK